MPVRRWLPAIAAVATSALTLLALGPFGLDVLSTLTCAGLGGVLLAILVWNSSLFHVPASAVEANDIEAGTILALCTSFTALLLQTHHPLIAYAVERHSYLASNPLQRVMRTIMFVELALNGTSEDKDKLASWLRHIHVPIQGTVPTRVLAADGLEDMEGRYGYTHELMAYIVETLTWSVVSFHRRFGRRDQYVQLEPKRFKHSLTASQDERCHV